MVVLNTVEEAIGCLARLQEGEDVGKVEFGGELAALHIVIDGERYKGTVPTDLARGIWQFQKAMYGAAAYVLHGSDDIRSLTASERNAFELVFDVDEGSTELVAALGGFLAELGKGFSNMTSKHKAITIILITVLLAGGYGAVQVAGINAEVKKEQIRADQIVEQIKAVTNLVSASKEARRFNQAVEEGAKSVIRSVPDAEEISIGRSSFDEDSIAEVNKRSPRAKAEATKVTGLFKVYADTNVEPVRLTLYGPVFPGEFTVDFPGELESWQEDILWSAIKEKKEVRLLVIGAVVRDKVRSAAIAEVLPPEGQDGQAVASN